MSFGYNNLVVDMRSFAILAKTGYPVVFDVTHSVQLPGGQGTASGGQPEFIEPLARAGCAAGVDGVFLEVHDRPARALSDGTNALPLDQLPALMAGLNGRSWSARGGRDEHRRRVSLETASASCASRLRPSGLSGAAGGTFDRAVEILLTARAAWW